MPRDAMQCGMKPRYSRGSALAAFPGTTAGKGGREGGIEGEDVPIMHSSLENIDPRTLAVQR